MVKIDHILLGARRSCGQLITTITWLLAYGCDQQQNRCQKNTCQMLAILMAMRIRRCNAGHIAQWSTSVASCKATRCRHWASAHAVHGGQDNLILSAIQAK